MKLILLSLFLSMFMSGCEHDKANCNVNDFGGTPQFMSLYGTEFSPIDFPQKSHVIWIHGYSGESDKAFATAETSHLYLDGVNLGAGRFGFAKLLTQMDSMPPRTLLVFIWKSNRSTGFKPVTYWHALNYSTKFYSKAAERNLMIVYP